MVNLRKKIKSSELNRQYVKILNGVLQLTNRESEVLSHLFDINDVDPDLLITTTTRRELGRLLNLSHSNLSRIINSLKDKGLLYRINSKNWEINNHLVLAKHDTNLIEIVFTLELVDSNEDNGQVEI